MIAQNANQTDGPAPYACWVYENGSGEPLLLKDKDDVAKALKDGFSDCPTKAKAAKPTRGSPKAE